MRALAQYEASYFIYIILILFEEKKRIKSKPTELLANENTRIILFKYMLNNGGRFPLAVIVEATFKNI